MRFLQYVVEETLAGRKDNLKERTIGVAAFNRAADYDSEADPVVRQVAVDVRKRLLQYYACPENHPALRIEIPHGSYVASFRDAAPPTLPAPAPVPAELAARRNPWKTWHAAAAAVLIAVSVLVFQALDRSAPLDLFWEPVLSGAPQILLCIGKGAGFRASTAIQTEQRTTQKSERDLNVHSTDALVMSRLSAFLAQHKKPVLPRDVERLTFSELRESPVVLIGAFNNNWSLRFTGDLRYQFRASTTGRDEWVEDTTQPGVRKWGLSNVPTDGDVAEDYAIVTRALNPRTGRMIVVLGGLTYHATMAAGEFVTNPESMRIANSMLPENWSRKNLQIVLATRVTANQSGPPRVIASYIW
jgi:hypothetical protein